MKLNFANQADILRCQQKDENFIEILKNLYVESLQVFGVRTKMKLHNFKEYIGVIYYACTSLCNLQTLGEEYMGTIRLNRCRNQTFAVPSFRRNFLWIVTFFFGENILLAVLKQFRFTIDSDFRNLLGIIYKLHRIIFFVNAKYLNISDRLFAIKYVLLKNWTENSQVKFLFRIVSVLSVIAIVTKIRGMQKNTENRNEENDGSVAVAGATNVTRETCILCNAANTNPTCLTCGHIFCWHCISRLWQSSEQCPICRQFFKPDRIVLLQNYF